MVTGIKDNLGGWILILKAISHLRQLLKFCCMEAINEFVLFGVCLVLVLGGFGCFRVFLWDFFGFFLRGGSFFYYLFWLSLCLTL